jgi:predicted Zn-dependent protease
MIQVKNTSRDYNRKMYLMGTMAVLLLLPISACTVKRAPVQPGAIPKLAAPTPEAARYGKYLFKKVHSDYDYDSGSQLYDRLVEVFDHLTKAAEVDHLPWHLYLFDGPEIVDIRAVYGNYVFVWSGLFDVIENNDELAGLLATELSHTLAHHTDPVQFTLASDVFFSVAELATSLGVMVASQGAVVIAGQGWMKYAYVEISDLDSLDREYNEAHEREAAGIALLIMSRARYSPQALLDFWKRAAVDESQEHQYQRISRSLSPRERAAMLESLLYDPLSGS